MSRFASSANPLHSGRRILAAGGLILLIVVAGAVLYSTWQRRQTLVTVSLVPAEAEVSARRALELAGFPLYEGPFWAGQHSSWEAPGLYRLYFLAASAAGGVDVFSAYVQVGANNQARDVRRIQPLTQTPDGEEAGLILAGTWLAFATRVGESYQSVTCFPLHDPNQLSVFIFDQPPAEVYLAWDGQSGRLIVEVKKPSQMRWMAEPASGRIEPADGGLIYLAQQRGEMPWLPRLVSRIRELPGVGPEKIAFLENVFFTLLDYINRIRYGKPEPALSQEEPPPPPHTPTAQPNPSPSEPPLIPTETAAVSAGVSPTPTLMATATMTAVPSPTLSPTQQGTILAEGIVWRDTIRPDPQRPYASAEVIEIDPALLQIKMVPGTWEPRPTTGLVGSGVIPIEDWPALVAAFNGGFAAMHGHYGMMVERKVYLPARDGVATLAVYEDGSIRMGTWGQDLKLTPDMVSYRQNCPPLIERGVITAETGKLTLWGLSVSNEVYLYRSGLGITKDGRLIYVAGKPLSAYTLALALQKAGAEYAMQLDVDEFHVVWITYEVIREPAGGRPRMSGRKLRADMRGFDSLFLQPFQLDFFYLTRRPQRLAQPVRTAPTAQPTFPVPNAAPLNLPGWIAFASAQNGNWDIYVMKPGQPKSVRRLTDHPADDLYPSWSPDGRRIAFTSRRDGNAEIYILNLESGALHRVTEQPSEEWAPTWSPDGQKLAYQSDRNGQSDIYVNSIDGRAETRITYEQGNHEAPHWSPDGRFFVFDSDLDVTEAVHASINVYIMGADGSQPRRLISHAESPAWSPDGKRIAFTAVRAGLWQVFIINSDGSGLRQLTTQQYNARYPRWSPDGQWIVFAGNAEGHWELYVIPASGGNPSWLTQGQADSSYPSWGP